MKKCAFCAEAIQDEAIKCRHCGEFLTDDSERPILKGAVRVLPEKTLPNEKLYIAKCVQCEREYQVEPGKANWCLVCRVWLPQQGEESKLVAEDIRPGGGESASVKSTLSSIATSVLGLVVMIALFALPVLLIMGGLVVGQKLLPWLIRGSILVLFVDIIILVPLAFIRTVRPWAGLGLVFSSYVFGLTGWFMGLLLTWALWGGLAVFIGLCFVGVGVVPMAMLATLFKGMWLELGVLILAIVLTFGIRILGAVLAET